MTNQNESQKLIIKILNEIIESHNVSIAKIDSFIDTEYQKLTEENKIKFLLFREEQKYRLLLNKEKLEDRLRDAEQNQTYDSGNN